MGIANTDAWLREIGKHTGREDEVERVIAAARPDLERMCSDEECKKLCAAGKGPCRPLDAIARHSGLFATVAFEADPSRIAEALDAAAMPIGGWQWGFEGVLWGSVAARSMSLVALWPEARRRGYLKLHRELPSLVHLAAGYGLGLLLAWSLPAPTVIRASARLSRRRSMITTSG